MYMCMVLHDVTIENEDFNDSCNLFINLVICRIWNKSLSKMYKLYKMTTVTKISYNTLHCTGSRKNQAFLDINLPFSLIEGLY